MNSARAIAFAKLIFQDGFLVGYFIIVFNLDRSSNPMQSSMCTHGEVLKGWMRDKINIRTSSNVNIV